MNRKSRRRRCRFAADPLGIEPLEMRCLLSGSAAALSAQSIDQIVWQGQPIDVRPGYWNGRFESAVPYGQPAIPQALLPLPTWTTFSLGGGFFSLSAPGADEQLVVDWAAATLGVLEIEPDFIIDAPPAAGATGSIAAADSTDPSAVPNDPYYPLQYAPPLIQAPAAWGVSTGNRIVVVAVLDSGIDLAHPDLAANVWINPRELPVNGIDDELNGFVDDVNGWNFIDGTNNVQDGFGHGTHVAGIIGAVGNNAVGVAGLGWQVALMPLKILNNSGVGTASAAVAAINYVTMLRRDFETNIVVSNNSWGAGGIASTVMRDAIRAMGDVGITFVAAAGNSGSNNDIIPNYPSSYDVSNVISVAASTPDDSLAGFSNYGATTVDLAAPGTVIYSTVLGGAYNYLSGTSMAAPQVAGSIALLAAAKPSLAVAQIRAAILGSTDTIPGMVGKTVTGGRLNVTGAMKSLGLTPVVPPTPPPPPPPPTPAVQPFLDDFNQPNSPTLSGFWRTRIGSIGIVSQTAQSRVAGASISTLNGVSIVDSLSQAFFNLRTGTNVGLVARYSGGGDTRMYLAGVARSGTGFAGTIWRNTGAGWTVIGSGIVTASSGVMQFGVAGSSLTLFVNGIRVAGAYDTAISGPGGVGIRFVGAGASIDNYSQSTLTAPVRTNVTLPFTETFSGTDSPYVPASWTKRIGNLAVSSNVVVSRLNNASIMALNGATARDSSQVAFVNVVGGTVAGLVARYTGTGDARMYLGGLQRAGTSYVGRIWVNTGLGWRILNSGPALGGSGVLQFDVAGSALTLYLNGKKVAAAYSTAIPGPGALGIRFVGPGVVADNYTAAALTPPVPAAVTSPFGDSFIRANSNYISGNWIQGIGNVAISDDTVLSRIGGVSLVTLRGPAPRDSSTSAQAVVNIGDGQSAWLFARHSGTADNRMYIAGLVRDGDRYFGRIWRNTGCSHWTQLASVAVPGGSGRIRFDCIGPSLTLFLNGVKIAAVRDYTIPGPGTVGLRLVGDGTTIDSYSYVRR